GQGHCATTNCLTIGGLNQDFNGVGIIRQLDLSHAVEATLSFSYLRQANPSTAKVHIAVSDDGGTNWSSLATYTLDGDDNVQVSESFDLTAYMATNTQIRFLGEGAGSGEQVISFDNIQVAYTTNSAEMAVSTHDFIQLSGAEAVWEQNIDGDGITVAVIDTGHWSHPGLDLNSNGQQRLLAQYNAITDEMDMADSPVTTDESGHGTHVSSLILNSQDNGQGAYHGVAPDANLVSIKAFDANGTGAYPDVIRGIDWAVTHKDTYNIRILNLSFSALPQSNYWDDPLNQAVM
ncbi:MAG: S8 family serine peptidase, partial [Chloroflexi bacterium]|nr:S8 family serine peptidase [Chloroflexota bacterium]